MNDLQIRLSDAPESASLQIAEALVRRAEAQQTDPVASTNFSFRVVKRAEITVNNLSVHMDPAQNPFENARALFRRRGDAFTQTTARRKTILNGLIAHMPSGSLTAVMGASGSGKTSLLPGLSAPL